MSWSKKLFILLTLIIIIPFAGCEAQKKKKEYQNHLRQGEKYYSDSNFEKAIEEFKLAAKIVPKSDEAYQNIAVCYSNLFLAITDPLQKSKKVEIAENAIKYYQKVLEIKPDNSEAKQNIANEYAKVGNMFMNEGQFPEALPYLKKRTELDPNNAEGFYTIGVLDWGLCFDNRKLYNILSTKNFVENLKASEDAVAQISKVSGISKEIVPQLLDAINVDEATMLGKLDKKNLLARMLGIPKTKKEHAEKALECVGQSTEDIITCIAKSGEIKIDEAKQFRAVLSKNPENIRNYIVATIKGINKNAAGKAVDTIIDLLKNEAIEDGMKSLNKAIELNPNYPDAYNYLVLLYVEKIKLEKDRKKQDEYIKIAADYSAKASKLRDPNKPENVIKEEIQAFLKAVEKVRGKGRI